MTKSTATKKGRVAAVKQQPGPEYYAMASVAKIAPSAQPPFGSPAWLQAVIDNTTAPHVEFVNLTPALAKDLLDRNDGNRSIRQTKMLQFACDMIDGKWAMNGEPIIVSADGRLNDGQHRCLAAIEANTSIPVVIMFGIDRETRLTVDQGGARTAGDFLGMEGVQNAAAVAAIARLAIAFERNDGRAFTDSQRITSREIRERVATDEGLARSATFGHTEGSYSRNFIAASSIGFAHYVLSRINRADAEEWLARVCRGDGIKLKDPAHTLREKLIGAGRLGRDKKLKMLLQAWNFHRRGMKVGPSHISSEPPFPALF